LLWAGTRRHDADSMRCPGCGQLGAIGGQVVYQVARRMKRCGPKRKRAGGDNLVRLLAADGNGELDGLAGGACPAQPAIPG